MTPEEAQNLIDAAEGLSPRLDHDLPYIVDGKDIVDMTQQIAAMKWEYRAESTKGAEFASSPWTDEKEARDIVQKSRNALTALGIDPTGHVRLVRRLVSPPEEVKP